MTGAIVGAATGSSPAGRGAGAHLRAVNDLDLEALAEGPARAAARGVR